MKRVLLTGAEGLIGTLLRERLATEYDWRFLTREPVAGLASTAADIADLEQIRPAFTGVDAVVQLAGYPTLDGDWDTILHNNIVGLRNVFEAARMAGVERVVYASSNHAVGMFEEDGLPGIYDPRTPGRAFIDHTAPWRPDSLYGVSKSFGEALGRYYSERFGLTVLCLRIGSVLPDDNPAGPRTAQAAPWLPLTTEQRYWRMAATWLSHADTARLVDRALAAGLPRGHFDIFYGVSNNVGRFWDLGHAESTIGFRPHDRAMPPGWAE